MPTKPEQKFTSWSFSRLQDYEKCPLRAKFKHIEKRREPGSPAMDRGTRIHLLAQQYATKVIKKLPDELKLFKKEFEGLRKQAKHLMVEQDWALARDWTATDWFDSDAAAKGQKLPWVRLRMDAALPQPAVKTLRVIDHKTGKIRGEYVDQLELYATVSLALMEEIDTVSSELWFLDAGELIQKTFKRSDLKKLKTKWEKRVQPMFNDRAFAPTPSDECRWCFFGQSGKVKGGPGVCQY